MTGSAPRTKHHLSTREFVALATARLSLDLPEALTDPNVILWHGDLDAEPVVMAAIATEPPSRMAAVLVSIIARAEPTVLFTQRTGHLGDHAGQVSFPGGKIDPGDVSPVAAALREADEEIALNRRFVEPIGYLDVQITPSGFRILPTVARVREGFVARVREGFAVQVNRGEVEDAFEVPLAFLMDPQNYRRESADWNGLTVSVYAIPFNGRSIWGVTAGILRNLWERIYRD
jgi:8-oxo-dGTP pyrophosphatase MutT (NUDIX family)